jgi:hypothetical protein
MLPIKLTLAGGLGNQLFQVSAGLYLEKTLQREIIYDISNLRDSPTSEIGNYTRRLEILDLIGDNALIRSRFPFRWDTASRFLRRIQNPSTVLVERNPLPPILNSVNENTNSIYGYFQDSKLVSEIWPELRVKLENSSTFAPIVTNHRLNRILIHLRFGDYSDDPKTKSVHGLTSSSYFKEALAVQGGDSSLQQDVCIVTDDSRLARNFIETIDSRSSFQIISSKNPISDLIDISRSSNVITSNSTFSWWGAWFASKLHGSKVIFPRPWFADPTDPDLPIYVPSWIPLYRNYKI